MVRVVGVRYPGGPGAAAADDRPRLRPSSARCSRAAPGGGAAPPPVIVLLEIGLDADADAGGSGRAAADGATTTRPVLPVLSLPVTLACADAPPSPLERRLAAAAPTVGALGCRAVALPPAGGGAAADERVLVAESPGALGIAG